MSEDRSMLREPGSMRYRSVAVHVNASARATERIELASAIANAHAAHLIGVSATGLVLTHPGGYGAESGILMADLTRLRRARCVEAAERFDAIAARDGVASYEHRIADDEDGYAMALTGRYADLLVIGQASIDDATIGTTPNFPEQVLLDSGRPVLVVPHAGHFERVGEVVVVAWDASRESARAVTDALPLLAQARQVHVVIVNGAPSVDGHGAEPGADIALFLARHDVEVVVHRETSSVSVADILLSRAADLGADLLVMGGFGHSRFREMILGGVTRQILEQMTVPVLISH